MGQSGKVIIDTDPGVDDAIAILMALAQRRQELIGITTVGGNVPVARGTRNALALLEYSARQEVPVARGAARPCRGRFGYSYDFHGRSGLSRRLPEPRMRPVSSGAADFLAAKLQENPDQITLVALGPLTNLAGLMSRHPAALEKAASLVVMGGAVNGAGNVTPYAEFNFHSDPVAAHAVLSSGTPLTLVDLQAGRRTSFTREAAQRLQARGRIGRLAARLLSNWFRREPRRQRFELYDPLTVAVALQPGLISARPMKLAVETVDSVRAGQVRVVPGSGTVSVVESVDENRFWGMLEELFHWSYR